MTAAGAAGTDASDAPVGTARCADASGGTDSTGSGDAKLIVRGHGAGPSH